MFDVIDLYCYSTLGDKYYSPLKYMYANYIILFNKQIEFDNLIVLVVFCLFKKNYMIKRSTICIGDESSNFVACNIYYI